MIIDIFLLLLVEALVVVTWLILLIAEVETGLRQLLVLFVGDAAEAIDFVRLGAYPTHRVHELLHIVAGAQSHHVVAIERKAAYSHLVLFLLRYDNAPLWLPPVYMLLPQIGEAAAHLQLLPLLFLLAP